MLTEHLQGVDISSSLRDGFQDLVRTRWVGTEILPYGMVFAFIKEASDEVEWDGWIAREQVIDERIRFIGAGFYQLLEIFWQEIGSFAESGL